MNAGSCIIFGRKAHTCNLLEECQLDGVVYIHISCFCTLMKQCLYCAYICYNLAYNYKLRNKKVDLGPNRRPFIKSSPFIKLQRLDHPMIIVQLTLIWCPENIICNMASGLLIGQFIFDLVSAPWWTVKVDERSSFRAIACKRTAVQPFLIHTRLRRECY